MVIPCVVCAPGDQLYVAAGDEVRTTLSPVQNVSGPDAVITGAGVFGKTVTVTGSDIAVHPVPLPVST